MHASRARVTALLTMLIILAWLPGAAVEWLSNSRVSGSPRLQVIPGPTRPVPPLPSPPTARYEYQGIPSHIDLRGNEIARPVARYSVDHRGALYELHSPLTEVPRLSPPEL